MDSPSPISGALLVCIDMQPVFIRAMPDAERVQKRCAFALAAAAGLGLPCAFTEQVPAKLGPTADELLALVPQAPVYAKETFSALADEHFNEAVTSQKIEHLLLCGIETPICVYQTAVAAIQAGLSVTVLSDAISARRSEDARFCLETLVRSGVHVLPSETVFYSLLRDVKHPFFKAYTQLVKTHG
jgi:nicotinamidase-related amidase